MTLIAIAWISLGLGLAMGFSLARRIAENEASPEVLPTRPGRRG